MCTSTFLHVKLALVLGVLLQLLPYVTAQDGHVYYSVQFNAPEGAVFTSLSGNMVAPCAPKSPDVLLLAGLQPSDNSGVLQQVLGNENGTSWYWDTVWCCADPDLIWGPGFIPNDGETLTFTNVETIAGSGIWNTTVGTTDDASKFAGQQWTLPDGHVMTQALFVIELYAPATWNTGPLTFTDVVMIADTSDTSWCTASPMNSDNGVFEVSTPTATTNGAASTCSVASIVLVSST